MILLNQYVVYDDTKSYTVESTIFRGKYSIVSFTKYLKLNGKTLM